MFEEELDEIQFESGVKGLWTFFYQLRTADLLDKYPNTSGATVQLAVKALQDFNAYEQMNLTPEAGGRDQQAYEWVIGMETCHAAQSQAQEDIRLQEAIEKAEEELGSGEAFKTDETG